MSLQEWDPTKHADDSQSPVTTIINSFELCGAGFNLQEMILQLLRRRHAREDSRAAPGLRQIEVMGRKRFVLSADGDNVVYIVHDVSECQVERHLALISLQFIPFILVSLY